MMGGNQRARVARMTRLAAGPPTALPAPPTHALPAREAIGRRRFGGRGRILLAEGELSLEVADALGVFGDLPLALGQLSAQPFILAFQTLLGVRARSSLGLRHVARYAHAINLYSPLNCYQVHQGDARMMTRRAWN